MLAGARASLPAERVGTFVEIVGFSTSVSRSRAPVAMLARAVDALIHPQVKRFSLSQALRMGQDDVLRGSGQAARILFDAYTQHLHGDSSQLTELADSGSVNARLHASLAESAAEGDQLAVEEHIVDAKPMLRAMRLVVGARRSEFESSSARFIRKFRCTLGQHLVVVGERPEGLTNSRKQRDLLLKQGCTVQACIDFASETPFRTPQQVILEAEVPGHALVEDLLSPHRTEPLRFSVVDVNGILGGNEFWAKAEEVSGWHRAIFSVS